MDVTFAAIALLAGFAGGFVRGYSGFGFAMAAVPIMIVVVVPSITIPAVLIHEMLIGIATIGKSRAALDPRLLRTLVFGSLVGTPVGLFMLIYVPAELMRIVIPATLIVAVAVLWMLPRIQFPLRSWHLLAAGLTSGVLNGSTAASGPPAILLLLASGTPAHVVRSVLIWFICFSALLAVTLAVSSGMIAQSVIKLALIMTPGVLLGTWIGSKAFQRLPAKNYRTYALLILFVVALFALFSATF